MICAALAGLAIAGCAPKRLYVAHDTVLGINAKVNEARQQGQLVIGYDRDFATIIPTSVKYAGGAEGETDAMALVQCTELQVDGIFLSKFSDFTATGQAAIDLSVSDPELGALSECDLAAAKPANGG